MLRKWISLGYNRCCGINVEWTSRKRLVEAGASVCSKPCGCRSLSCCPSGLVVRSSFQACLTCAASQLYCTCRVEINRSWYQGLFNLFLPNPLALCFCYCSYMLGGHLPGNCVVLLWEISFHHGCVQIIERWWCRWQEAGHFLPWSAWLPCTFLWIRDGCTFYSKDLVRFH